MGDKLGGAVAIHGDIIAVGSRHNTNTKGAEAGEQDTIHNVYVLPFYHLPPLVARSGLHLRHG